MFKRLIPVINSLFNIDYYERKKITFLGIIYFCIIASYSILRPLKTSVFAKLVGVTYQPYTKLLMILLIFPIMYLYALLIDRVKRDNIMHVIFIGYATACLLFAYFLFDPITGLPNVTTSPHRIVGWLFYIAMDLFSPIIMTTFWSYTNSINTPETARHGYSLITVASRVGGIISTEIAIRWLTNSSDETQTIPLFIAICGILLFSGSIVTYFITKTIPASHLEGYKPEAVIEEKEAQSSKDEIPSIDVGFFKSIINNIKQTFEGLRLLIVNPYVFGIFGVVYGFEIICSILDYQMQFLMIMENNNSIKASSLFMLRYTNMFQYLALFFAIFGTAPLMEKLGVRLCLTITPLITMIVMVALLFNNSLFLVTSIMVILRALNYGFNTPVREMLFIPTSHDIRYKAKAWIESAGRTFSKSSGALVNISSQRAAALAFTGSTLFSLAATGIWLMIALLVGTKYNQAVKNHKVIGRNA